VQFLLFTLYQTQILFLHFSFSDLGLSSFGSSNGIQAVSGFGQNFFGHNSSGMIVWQTAIGLKNVCMMSERLLRPFCPEL
jgi:hypothetical protein